METTNIRGLSLHGSYFWIGEPRTSIADWWLVSELSDRFSGFLRGDLLNFACNRPKLSSCIPHKCQGLRASSCTISSVIFNLAGTYLLWNET